MIHLSDISPDVKVKILTKSISEKLNQAIEKFSAQYFQVEVEVFKKSHDRFVVIDNSVVYHFGASLKDLGKKWFAFSKFDKSALELLGRLEDI